MGIRLRRRSWRISIQRGISACGSVREQGFVRLDRNAEAQKKMRTVKIRSKASNRKGYRNNFLSFSALNILRKVRDAYIGLMWAAASKGHLRDVLVFYNGPTVTNVYLGRRNAGFNTQQPQPTKL